MTSARVFLLPLGAFLALAAVLSVLPPRVGGRKHWGVAAGEAPPGPLTLATVQCLAHCFTQLNINPLSHQNCQLNTRCEACARMCDLLQSRPATYRPACRQPACNKGCQTACGHNFRRKPESPKWEFPASPTLAMIDSSAGVLRWHRPRPLSDVGASLMSRQVKVVYVIMRREGAHWTPVTWTLGTNARLQVALKGRSPHFRLLAVSSEGVIARVTLPEVPSRTSGIGSGDGQDDDSSSGEVPAWHVPPKVASMPPGVFGSVQVRMHHATSGHLSAVVTWSQHLDTHSATYTVTWLMKSCNVNASFPHCPLASSTRTTQITTNRKKTVKVTFKDLIRNAEYVVDVGFTSHPTERVIFVTPPCRHPGATWRHCAKTPGKAHHVTSLENTVTSATVLTTDLYFEPDMRSDEHQSVVPKKPSRWSWVALTATLASLVGVAAIGVAAGTHLIYRRCIKNKHSVTLASRQYRPSSLAAMLTRATPLPAANNCFRHSSLSATPPPSPPPLNSSCETLADMDLDSELPRVMWTRLSEGSVSGDLQHLTLTPPEVTSGHAHSTPEVPFRSGRFSRVGRLRRIVSTTASPILARAEEDEDEDDDVDVDARLLSPRWSSSDLEVDTRTQTLESFQDQVPVQGRHTSSSESMWSQPTAATTTTTIATSTSTTTNTSTRSSVDHLHPRPPRDGPMGGPDLALAGADVDDVENSVLARCCSDFSASLYLSAVDPGSLSDDDDDDDVFEADLSDNCRALNSSLSSCSSSSSCSTQEGSYHIASPEPGHLEQFSSFLWEGTLV